jgi:hypothetical protein
MRTYIGLTLNALVQAGTKLDRIEQSKRVSQTDAMAYIRDRVTDSVWSPSWHLSEQELAELISEARALRRTDITSGAAVAAVQRLEIDEKARTLAENTLMLLAQFKHGTSLEDTHPTSLVVLADGETGCWALITVNKETVDVRVRSDDRSALQSGTGKLLALLDIVDNQHLIRRRSDVSHVLRIRPGEQGQLRMSHKDGSRVGEFKVDVLGAGGRLLNALRQPLPRALWIAGVVLGGISALFQWIWILHWPASQDPWYPWWHDLVDRVFTTVLWAAAFATIQGLQRVGPRWRTTRGGQVRIEW